MTSLLVLVPVLLFFGWATWAYNRMVQARNQQGEAWSGVDVQLKKRSTLIADVFGFVTGAFFEVESSLERAKPGVKL